MAEKVKPIILKDNDMGRVYTLEFDRNAQRVAARNGFALEDLDRYPILIYDFFYYAFLMHHGNISKEKTDKIIDECWGGLSGIPEGLLGRLVELWLQVYEATDTGEEKKGNPRMTVEL